MSWGFFSYRILAAGCKWP